MPGNLLAAASDRVHAVAADAVNVCFNSIAILFLLEVDNLAYATILGERSRARVEEAGRVELGDEDVAALTRSKAIHVCGIVFYILFEISALNSSDNGLGWMVFPPFIVWAILGAVEICCTLPPARCVCDGCGGAIRRRRSQCMKALHLDLRSKYLKFTFVNSLCFKCKKVNSTI